MNCTCKQRQWHTTPKIKRKVRAIMLKYKTTFTPEEKRKLTPYRSKIPHSYGLPKIHRPGTSMQLWAKCLLKKNTNRIYITSFTHSAICTLCSTTFRLIKECKLKGTLVFHLKSGNYHVVFLPMFRGSLVHAYQSN